MTKFFGVPCAICTEQITAGEQVTLSCRLLDVIRRHTVTIAVHKECWERTEDKHHLKISIGFHVVEAVEPIEGTFTARFLDDDSMLPRAKP